MSRGTILPFLFCFLLSPLPAFSQVRPPAILSRVFRAIEYAHAGERSLLLDLYVPPRTTELVPVVLYIHGGDWMFGNRGHPPVLFLVQQGFAVASIDYRLAPQDRFPAQIRDCRDALLFLHLNAKRYGINSEHIGVIGESAGGHLAALLGTAPNAKEFIGTRRAPAQTQVQAVCAVSGPMDIEYLGEMADMAEDVIGKHPIQQLLGGTIEQKRDLARLASPIRHISQNTPAFLLVFGDQDFVVPPLLSRNMYKALMEASVDVQAHEVKGMAHDMRKIWNDQTTSLISSFFRHQLIEVPATQPAAALR
jgi:acetyl esterase/lipase